MWRRYILICSLLLCFIGVGNTQAQEQAEEAPIIARNVAFIDDNAIRAAAPSDIGADGISRLVELFRGLGASTRSIRLRDPVPADVDLVVLIRPSRQLNATQTAHLWQHLANGGHLLLAVDSPVGHNNVRGDISGRSGILTLTDLDYGINLENDLLIEPWFTFETLNDIVRSWSYAEIETIPPHIITELLSQYELPVRYWGARSLYVEAITGISDANALIYTESLYGETGRLNFRSPQDGEPLVLNIGDDTQGHLLLGAISTNTETGSRIAIMGDSEIFQNIYGLTRVPNRDDVPLYPGTYLFVERLASWLMGFPEDDYPDLPAAYTWLQVDGDASDWADNIVPVNNPESNVLIYSLSNIRSFRNNQFVYMLLNTTNPIPDSGQVRVDAIGEDGNIRTIEANVTGVFIDDERIADAAIAFGDVIELRLPRRYFDFDAPVIAQTCVAVSIDSQADCYEEALTPQLTNQLDPVQARFGNMPSAFVTNGGNLRAQPAEDAALAGQLPARELLAVFGRNEAGDWLRVRNGRFDGWMAAFLLTTNGDIDLLPIIEMISPAEETPSPESTTETDP